MLPEQLHALQAGLVSPDVMGNTTKDGNDNHLHGILVSLLELSSKLGAFFVQ